MIAVARRREKHAAGVAPAEGRRSDDRRERRPGVVRDLAGPDELPQRGQQLGRVDADLVDEIEPELRAPTERLADAIVDLALGALGAVGPAEHRGVLAEEDRDAVEAGADPDELPGGGWSSCAGA